jgi:hypothetical protein
MGKVNHIIHLVLVYYSMLNINSQCIFVFIGNKNNLMLTFAIQAWNNFLGSCSTESKNDILDKNIFGNSEIKFNRNPLFFQSF